MEFDVWFEGPEGGTNHSIVEANYMSEACEYVESVKGGEVFKCEKRSAAKAQVAPSKRVDNLFELKQKGADRSDATARYTVVLKCDCTVKELINSIISTHSGQSDRGEIRVVPAYWVNPLAAIKYESGVASMSLAMPKFANCKVKEAEADGGWGLLDFEIIVE